ncbi:crystallin J1A-like [Diadema antillarum]|uniref:crystallin J1A-like n=1 Tax=Diadema antillarum TaxID=105358 RepID=UPI003A8C107B
MAAADVVNQRAVAAIIGALVGDAAAQPIHWIYNLNKLKDVLGSSENPEFRVPSANPFYCIETGKNTCYGDQTLSLLESLVRCGGLDTKDFAKTQYRYFGPDTEYEDSANAKYVMKSGVRKGFPIQAAWRNQVIKDFMKKYEAGMEETGSERSKDMHAIIQVVPVAALYAGRPEMLDKVEEAVSVTMTADEAIVHSLVAARIVEHYILHGSGGNAVESVLKELRNPQRSNAHSLDQAIIGFLENVRQNESVPHFAAATKLFKNN